MAMVYPKKLIPVIPKKEIDLNWNNNNHGAITDKEKEEIEKDWERNKNIRYHYPVRRA